MSAHTLESCCTKQIDMSQEERVIKSPLTVTKDAGCSQSAVSKIWIKYKQNGKVVKEKHGGRPGKTSKCQDRKLKAIRLEQMETGVNVCDPNF